MNILLQVLTLTTHLEIPALSSVSSQAFGLIKILKPENKASCLNPSNPTLYLTREAHQPWQLMGRNSPRESQEDGAPPISNPYWGSRLWFMLMNGINFLKIAWGRFWSITEHNRNYVIDLYLKAMLFMAGKRQTADGALSFSLGRLLYNPKERTVCPPPALFLLSFFSQDIWHLLINKKKKKEQWKEGREGNRRDKNHLTKSQNEYFL